MKTDDETSGDNPFLALFPNAQHAKQYMEATRTGLERSVSYSSQGSQDSSSSSVSKEEKLKSKSGSIFDKISSSKQFRKTIELCHDIIVNDYIQRIFLVTVNPDEENKGECQFGGLPQRCVKLKELASELESGNQPLLLSMDNLNQALFERLQMQNTVENLCIQAGHRLKALNAVMDARDELLVQYLSNCYLRLDREEESLKRKCSKDKLFMEEITSISETIRSLISSFSGSILLQPDVFPTNNAHQQFFNVLAKSYGEPRLQEYVHKLIETHEPNDIETIFQPLLKVIWERSATLKLLHPDTHPLLQALSFFSKSLPLSKLLLQSDYWFPVSLKKIPANQLHQGGILFENETILGRFLKLSSITNPPNVSEFFLEPSRQNEADMNATTGLIQDFVNKIATQVHALLKNIVQRQETQHDVLYWLGLCLHLNRQRYKMFQSNPTASSSCGFFLNLNHVLLKFCEPFLNPESKIILKVDCRYCAASSSAESISSRDALLHTVGFSSEEPMVNKPDTIPPVLGDKIKYKFVSEVFFMTHQCYRIGYLKVFLKYQELMKQLQKLSNLYQDVRASGATEQMINDLKNDFENGMRTQLSMKAMLTNPELSDLAVKFCTASSYWLNQHVLAGPDYLSMTKPRELKVKTLPDSVSPALTVIPEYIPENIGDTVRLMGLFNEQALERCENLQYIMEFFSVFLGESYRLKNPHLRAKLAECFIAFLPKEKAFSNMFTFSYRKNAFNKSPVVPKLLPKSLLKLFVDIEFTGHAMEFEQKFTYRHYMYEILEYIWKLPGYHETFQKLYLEGKTVYKRDLDFSTFPRFINLLVNDSTFLLDEALQNLTMIKTLEQEKDNGEWNNLIPAEKKQKEDNLVQFGHLARAYNTMANETVHVLCYITKDIQRPFASPCMADGMAAFLNYFFVHLVGPKRKDLKVKDFEKYNFKPSDLVKNITCIYLSLGKEDMFCQAVVKDQRSYSAELFSRAIELLIHLDGAQGMVEDLRKLCTRLTKWHTKLVEREMPEPPDEFVDPISCMLMYEPVKLPSSGQILCRSTIAKHLLSDEKDPFNRSPLRLDQVIPCIELQERIHEWMRENDIEMPDLTADDCGG